MNKLKDFYNGKNVLVTGGAGFIGSHLVEKLVELGAHVSVLDNFSSGKLANLSSVLSHINILYADVTSHYSALKATFNKDIVFHLAAMVSIQQSTRYPELCNKINTAGTVNILDGCRQNHVGTMVFSSSSAIYGNRHDACSEDDIPNPQTPYAHSKFEAEQFCSHFGEKYNFKTSCLRYFNVYGERQNPNGSYAGVVAQFTDNLRNNKPLVIYGDGQQTRDFVHVSHVVEANLNIPLLDTKHGETFNIGTGKSINLFQLIKNLEQELNIQPQEIVFKESRQFDITHSLSNCNKYHQAVQNL
jgi:UDP-glucose 4-epimerase